MEMTISKFEEMNLYSNKTLERVISSLVNESSNAVFCNMYEDAVLLLDHKEGQFYLADYTFDQGKAQIKFESFEPIVLSKNENDFKADARAFFENDNASSLALVESYKANVLDKENFITDLITESMINKDFGEVVDYDALVGLNESEVSNIPSFKAYKNRISSHPTTSIKRFNWKDPVVVSLIETETAKVVNKRAFEKAASLWKKAEFKEAFTKAASVFVEDVETGTDMFKELFEDYPQVLKLDAGDRRALFGKTIISVDSLRENKKDIQDGLGLLFEKFDLKDMRKQYLMENEGEEETDEEEVDNPPEISPEDIEKIATELHKLAKKVEDEKVAEKIDDLADKLDGGKEGEASPEDIKEAVEILSL